MPKTSRLPTRFPVGSKYVVESCGPVVRRYIEFPNGCRVQLKPREAVSCTSGAQQQTGIVPDLAGPLDAPNRSRRIFA
jgi:hypothetical protein